MIWRLSAAFTLAWTAHALAESRAPGPLDSLHGFRLGVVCDRQEHAYAEMRQEGFDSPPARYDCYVHPGAFQTDYLLKDSAGRQELVELFYRPDMTLWRARATITWPGSSFAAPTPEQLQKSLVRRFGQPYLKRTDRTTSAGEDGLVMTWGHPKHQENVVLQALADASHSFEDLEGPVTQALVRWDADSHRSSVVVEATLPDGLKAAQRAQEDAKTADAVRQQDLDASWLGTL